MDIMSGIDIIDKKGHNITKIKHNLGYLKYKESITSDLSCSANARYKI